MKSFIDHISTIPLFEELSADQLEALEMITVENLFKKGEHIFSEGETASGFHVVITGRVKIFKMSPEGREQILHIFGPGELFGEAPVFAGQKFPANAEAMENSRVLFFPRDSISSLIEKNPSIALNMLAVLSLRLRMFTSLIDDLSLKEVPGRLAAYLIYTRDKKEDTKNLELTITKGQLASLLGTIPETLSRILKRMKGQGLIESDGRVIRIIDGEGLEDLAKGIRRL
jgi:CRP-like cAMP-binding protein